MHSRRNFLGNVATGLAAAAQPSGRVLGANDRIRVGIIGPGARGMELVHQAMLCPQVDMAAFCDVYTARLDAGKKVAPGAKTYMDYRYMLDDKSIDAVLIATPQHLHKEHFVATVEAGKHIFQNLGHALRGAPVHPEGLFDIRQTNPAIQRNRHFREAQQVGSFLEGHLGTMTVSDAMLA